MTQAVTKSEREVEPRMAESFETGEDPRIVRVPSIERLHLVWSNRRFLLRAVGLGFLAAIVVAFVLPKRYESIVRLMPPQNQSGAGIALLDTLANSPGVGMGSFVSDLMGVKTTGALFIGVLQSRTVRDRLVERFHLEKEYGTRFTERARQRLADNTEITEDRKSGIIALTVTDHNPNRAAEMAGAYVDELNTLMTQLTTSSAHRERVFLEQRLQAVKENLESAEKDFSQFASENATVNITEQGKALVESAAAVEGQLIAAQAELEGLKQIYTDNNARVRLAQARIAELRKQLERLSGRKANAASSASGIESNAQFPTLRQLPILGVPYADKFRRLKVEEAVYETLTKEYELAKVQEAKEIPTVKVLDTPDVPEKKSFPPRLLIIFAGSMCSFIVGVMWVLGMARWSDIDSQDPGKVLAREVLQTFKARVPWVSPNGSASSCAEGNSLKKRSEQHRELDANQ